MPPGSSGCAAGGCLAGPAGALRPPKRRPGDVRPPLPPRPHLSPCPRGHALGGVGGRGGPAGRPEKGGRRRRPRRGRGKREPSRSAFPRPRPPPPRPGFLPRGGSLAPHAARGAGFVGPGRVEGPVPPSSRVGGGGGGGVCRGGGGEGRARSEGLRGERSGERVPVAAVRRPPLVAARRPADRRSRAASSPPPPLRTATVLLSSPPARLAPRVRGRKPAPRPARPRSWPRSRGLRAPGGDPRDAAASSAVARPPPVRGRVVPRRGPVPSFRVGAGRAPPPAGRRPPPPRARPPPPRGGGGSGGRWAGVCGGGARRPSRPRSVPLPPVVPGGAAGGAVGRGSLSLVFSPRRARLPTERPGAAGRRAGAAFRPPTRPPPPVRLPPSETRPQIRRGDPLNLSILVSGGKETNQDSLSNGE